MKFFQSPIITHLSRLALAAGISFIILSMLNVLVSSGHDQLTRPHIIELLSKTVLSGVGMYLVLHLIGLVIRAFRYRILLRASGENDLPNMWHMILVTGFRNMMVDMLPARIGELGYVAMLNRGYQVGAAACLSSLALATVFDFIALLFIVLAMFLIYLVNTGFEAWFMSAFAVLIVIIGIAFLCLYKLLPWFAEKLNALKARVQGTSRMGRLINSTTSLVHKVDDALQTARRSGTLTKVLILSIFVRSAKYLSIFLLFIAVVSPSFPDLAEIGHEKIFAATVGAEVGASLPIPTFMSFGTYEAGGTLIFSLLGVSEQQGLMSLLGVHIWSQAFDYAIGGLCLLWVLWLTRKHKTVVEKPRSQAGRLAFIGIAGVVMIVGLGALAWQYRLNTKLGANSAPPIGENLRGGMAAEVDASLQAVAATNIDGFIVWSSNRFGNHDILRMDFPNGKISQLTNHSHTETYPRVSPNGGRMVFVRSQKPWISQRNTVAWDLVVKDLYSGAERVLMQYASFPFWVDDNTVGYLYGGDKVMHLNIDTGDTIQINTGSLSGSARLTSPETNPKTGELVFTAVQSKIGLNTGYWGTAILRDQIGIQGIYNGCEINWSSDGEWLYQVSHGGKQKTMFYKIDPETLDVEPLLDLPGEYSHEYWPKDSNDGRYMVFGASKGGHEHDTEDYEMFLWEIGAPAEDAIRLTFHSGNDNWPDIYIK